LQTLIKNRVAAMPFNKTLCESDHLNEILTQINLIGLSSLSDHGELSLNVEEHLHELGVLSIITSSSFLPSDKSQVIFIDFLFVNQK
jgi:hypothetical protein